MGIYDREYYRREGPSFLDALLPAGTICKWLIGINIALYVLQLLTRPSLEDVILSGGTSAGPVTDWLILAPELVLRGQVWRLLTYAFIHSPDTVMHLLFNMLFLWWFGSDLEALYRPREFLAFYLGSAFFGGLAYQAWSMASGVPNPCLGASGAVTALLVLCACHFPNRTILLFFLFPVPIWLFAIINVAQDAFYFVGRYKTNVAVVVHLAGALFALSYYKFHFRLTDGFGDWWERWRTRRRASKARLRVYRPEEPTREEPVAVPAAGPGDVDEHLEARLDAVLEKIARSGRESLTDSERQILQRASEIYKRRRS